MSARVRLAGRLIEMRLTRGVSQRQLADSMHSDPSVISRIESAARIPSEPQLERWVLSCSVNPVAVEGQVIKLKKLRDEAVAEESADAARMGTGSAGTLTASALTASGLTFTHPSVTAEPVGNWKTGTQEPDPVSVMTVAELIHALNEVHIWAGAPSLRKIEVQSLRRGDDPLFKSTVSEMLRRPTLPPLERYLSFLRVCGVRDVEPWKHTWRRLKLLERRGKIGA
ncbi:helix-turn-helix transcriptional regulator [Streptomyces sp. NPDC046832]|uniref:helix-turn-helix domain-containing protein n=1 Tax=Streptomyces sp. NPDC046832 TaxID=3155020 RepID=UPI0033C172A0